MRPIIDVNRDCLWPCGDVCHSPPSLSAPRSHGKLRRRLTGTGVGSNFRFVADLRLKPAGRCFRLPSSVCGVRSALGTLWSGSRLTYLACSKHAHHSVLDVVIRGTSLDVNPYQSPFTRDSTLEDPGPCRRRRHGDRTGDRTGTAPAGTGCGMRCRTSRSGHRLGGV
jgi:hypothetical protein